MKVHEFQAKQLLREAGVAVPRGQVAHSAEEAIAAFDELGTPVVVVKAQIHAGGRGKGTLIEHPEQHGVQLVRTADEAREVAGRLLGNRLGHAADRSRRSDSPPGTLEEGCDIARELYLGIVLDRAAARPVLMASQEGGVEIEKVAAETPERIFKEHFDPHVGLQAFQVRKLCHALASDRWQCQIGSHFHAGTLPGFCRKTIAAWRRSIRWWSPVPASYWPWMPR